MRIALAQNGHASAIAVCSSSIAVQVFANAHILTTNVLGFRFAIITPKMRQTFSQLSIGTRFSTAFQGKRILPFNLLFQLHD
ncbi:unnamed protein product [Toxocara canis]|uniref:Uncharacterized protein n=1 Tax=Toxocara canis TaxID=6265 RepID=A0A183VH06_TOXCA|nr:unnamed protein product [Toxocara canis]